MRARAQVGPWRRCAGTVALLLAVGTFVSATPLRGQSPTVPDTRANPLERVISVSFADVLLSEALLTLRHTFELPLAWSGDVIPVNHRVSWTEGDAPLERILARILQGTGLRPVVTRLGAIVVVPSLMPSTASSTRTATSALPALDAAVMRGLRSTGVQQLDQVVVMGNSVSAGPERELPVIVRVVSQARVEDLGLVRLTDLVRTELPGLIQWDRGPTGPPAPFAAVRGVASFTTRAVKTYVDGVELASPELFTLLDARSVEQLEMIRGPQGAALYGPDALNGIVQLRTRHGRMGARTVVARGTATAGAYERRDLGEMQPSLGATAGVMLSDRRAAADLSAAIATVGRDSASRELQSWNLQAGGTALLGPVLLEASARAATFEFAVPRIAAAAASPSVPQQITEQAVAITATQQLTTRWRHSLVAGRHWINGDREPFRSPILPPRLPSAATFERASRGSIRYASTVEWSPAFELSGGAEYSVRDVQRELTRASVMNDLSALYANDLRATGAFAQTRLRLGSQFILSGGGRAERLSSVGPRQGLVWASMIGASWNRAIGETRLRVRAAWGRGIRPPEPGMSVSRTTSTVHQIANPDMAPERQRGVEGGGDVFFANGAFLKVTAYEQYATDLLQQVSRRVLTGMADSYQFQNVGVVRNRGLEFETGWSGSRWSLASTLHVPRSEVRSLSPRYTGELRPGDRMIEVPELAGSAHVRATSGGDRPRWSAEVGATVLGPYTGYDWLLLARIERGQATRRDLVRDYWMRYPGVVRPYLVASTRLRGDMRAFLRVDNPANNAALIRDNLSAPLGRTVLMGLELSPR